jgi:hypothetical protein
MGLCSRQASRGRVFDEPFMSHIISDEPILINQAFALINQPLAAENIFNIAHI